MEDDRLAAAEIDNWYHDREGAIFKVVALEEDGEAIEVQHYDGTVAELDRRAWVERRPRAIEAPEDWSGAVDISGEDFRVNYDEDTEPDHENPLDRLDGVE